MLKKFFIKRFQTYAMIMIIPMLLLFIIMGYLLIDTQKKDFEKMGVHTVDSVNENILNNIYSTIEQQDDILRYEQHKLSMKKLLSHELLEYRDIIFMYATTNFLRSYENSYSYIHSIYLYMDGLDNLLTSSYAELATFKTYYDIGWYDQYRKIPSDSNQFIESRKLQRYSYDKEKDVITLYQRMSGAKGVIILNVNKSDFREKVLTILNPSQSVFFLDKEGEVLFSSSKEVASDVGTRDGFFTNIVKEYAAKDKSSFNQKWVKLNGKSYLFYIQPNDQFQTYMVSMISYDAFAARMMEFVGLSAAILSINILIVMLLSWITTNSAFKHITYLVDVFSAAERGEVIEEPQPVVKDEYNLILNNILFLYIKNSQMQVALLEKQHQNQVSELMALQLQINPHFIFNTLQTMDLEVMKELGGQSTLHTLVQELSRIMKYALVDPTEAVTMREELNYLKAYLEIQEVRFNNNIVTYYEIDESLYDNYVFRLMLQPVVENCVIHGIKSVNQRCYIKIKVSRREDEMHISVIDNGCGMSKQYLEELREKINDPKAKNIGLTNLNRRLILHYGEGSKLNIQSKLGIGTVIGFRIPIRISEGNELSETPIIS
jgi:sensor histidine kinase YesM